MRSHWSPPFISFENALEKNNFLTSEEKDKVRDLYKKHENDPVDSFHKKYPFDSDKVESFCEQYTYSYFEGLDLGSMGANKNGAHNDDDFFENWFYDLSDIDVSQDEGFLDFHKVKQETQVFNETHVPDCLWLSKEEKDHLIERYRNGDTGCIDRCYRRGYDLAKSFKSPWINSVMNIFKVLSSNVDESNTERSSSSSSSEFWTNPTEGEKEMDTQFQEQKVEEFENYHNTIEQTPFEGYTDIQSEEEREKILYYFKRALSYDELASFSETHGYDYKIEKLITRELFDKIMNEKLWEELNVNALLVKAGVENPLETDLCTRMGLIRGHFGFDFTGEQEQLNGQIGKSKRCYYCKTGVFQINIKDSLNYDSYSDGIRCTDCDATRFMGGMCRIRKSCACKWNDEGNYHCSLCPGLGECFGPHYSHCFNNCGRHTYGEFSREKCPCEKFADLQIDILRGHRSALAYVYFYPLINEEEFKLHLERTDGKK